MSIFRRHADASLRRENDELRIELAEAKSRVRILELEQELLLDVIQRDRIRVESEIQSYAAEIVHSERRGNLRIDDEQQS